MSDADPDKNDGIKHVDPHFDYSSGAAELRGEFYRPPEYLEYLEKAAQALKTVRIIVYATMTGFIILAIYGFLLIYRLTTDVHLAVAQTEVMTQQMQAMTRNMANMHQSISHMSGSIDRMDATIENMNGTVSVMSNDIARMTETVTLIQHSARNLDQSMGPLMGTVNQFMPLGGGYGGAPPFAR